MLAAAEMDVLHGEDGSGCDYGPDISDWGVHWDLDGEVGGAGFAGLDELLQVYGDGVGEARGGLGCAKEGREGVCDRAVSAADYYPCVSACYCCDVGRGFEESDGVGRHNDV